MYYKNSLCFADKAKVTLYNDWFSNEFSNPYISLNLCNNSTYNDKCATEEKIDEFLSENIFYWGQ